MKIKNEKECSVQVESTKETRPIPDQAAEVAEVQADFYHRLANGPVEDLVMFFGLGDRVARTLSALGCKRGPDVMKLDESKVFGVAGAGGVTCRRVLLLQRYFKLSKQVKI